MADNFENGLVALDHLCDDTAEIGTAAIGDRLKLIRDVIKGLVTAGVGVKNVWAWVPIILQLIQTVGPMVEKIVDLIKDAIRKGQEPDTFVIAA